MRRVAAAVLAVALLGGCSLSGPSARPAAAPLDRGLLWRVSSGTATSYLLGTVHLGRSVDDALGTAGRDALAEAETVVVEIDLDAAGVTLDLANLVVRRGRLPSGRTLDALLTPPAWEWLVDSLGSQLPAAGLRRTRPWLAVYLVIGARAAHALAPSDGGATAPRHVPMDHAIARGAKARGQRVVGLETAAEQVEALASMPESLAVAFLEDVARDPSLLDRQLRGTVETSAGPGARAGVERLVADYHRESPAMARAILYDRTARWMPRLVPLLADGDAFVAVGAGHLVGDRGLVALLEARGFDVAPLDDPAMR